MQFAHFFVKVPQGCNGAWTVLYLIKKEQGLPRPDFLFINGLDFACNPLGVQILTNRPPEEGLFSKLMQI